MEMEPKDQETKVITNDLGGSNNERFYQFLYNLYSKDIDKFEQAKLFIFPFLIDEKILDKINNLIIDILKKINNEGSIDFTSVTRFQDLTTLRIDSFKTFIEKAGDKKDPENCQLTWKIFSINEHGNPLSGVIELIFLTEKKLDNQLLSIDGFNRASVNLNVTGSSLDWVESSFAEIVPYVESIKLSGIYRPLWLFRNELFISIFSHTLSWVGFFIGIHFTSEVFSKEKNMSREEIRDIIYKTENIGEKINLLAREFLTPTSNPWWEPIITISAGALTFAILYYSGMYLLPKLTPNSYIAIGLSNIRAKKYINTFKFIVFSGIILGIVLRVLVSMFL